MAHRVLGATLTVSGEFEAARPHLDKAIALYRPEEHRSLAAKFGTDISVPALGYRALTLSHLGYPENALNDSHQALKTARELGLAGTLACALMSIALVGIWCSRFDIAKVHGEGSN
jgi:hypothetical protein